MRLQNSTARQYGDFVFLFHIAIIRPSFIKANGDFSNSGAPSALAASVHVNETKVTGGINHEL
jgi:hypothetical protein